eukprot:TRINITY_DN75186_c0_g1_i1.p1 TRINITY_DN75186_c0_g1~~TRINITY_DN75186_c0_g1_i1.p1  ORF type:complete len:895 (+),score=167.64 TRINITY_DN75186_c0_g1_i1:61-2745(+)
MSLAATSTRFLLPVGDLDLARTGLISGPNEEYQSRHREELRQMRRKEHALRKNGESSEQSRCRVDESMEGGQLPTGTYGSTCPAAEVPCCTVQPSDLPFANIPVVQAFFGNPADLASGNPAEEDPACKDHSDYFGLPSLKDSGWKPAKPHVLSSRSNEEKALAMKACQLLGLSVVERNDTERGLLMAIEKKNIPATSKEVRKLIQQLKQLRHTNVVCVIEACEDENTLSIIYEDCEGKAHLMTRLAKHEPLSQNEGAKLMQQISAAVVYVASQRLHVLDWSLWNVMCRTCGSFNQAKVFGVGLAGVLYRRDLPNGTPTSSPDRAAYKYRAPELCALLEVGATEPFRKLEPLEMEGCDVWSIAAILFTALSGHEAFNSDNEKDSHGKIMNCPMINITELLPEVHTEGILLFERCFSRSWKLRPRAKSLVEHQWVMSMGLSSCSADIDEAVNRFVAFCYEPKLSQSLRKLLLSVLPAKKRIYLEDLFSSIDIHGTGVLNCDELMCLASSRKVEIMTAFNAMPGLVDRGINKETFVHVNVVSENIITERMLKEAFQTIDTDGGGELGVLELYRWLVRVQEDLTVTDVADFMAFRDGDWDMSLDFEEFKRLFPQVASVQRAIDEHLQRQRSIFSLMNESSINLHSCVKAWLRKLMVIQQRVRELRHKNQDFEMAGSPEVIGDSQACLADCKKAIDRMPIVDLPPQTLDVLQLKRFPKRGSAGFENASGIFALDIFLKHKIDRWYRDVHAFEITFRDLAVREDDHFKDETENIVEETLGRLTAFIQDISAWVQRYAVEQRAVLEATMELECSLPPVNWSRRGRIEEIHDPVVQERIEEFQRQELADGKKHVRSSLRQTVMASRKREDSSQAYATVHSAVGKLGAALANRIVSIRGRHDS